MIVANYCLLVSVRLFINNIVINDIIAFPIISLNLLSINLKCIFTDKILSRVLTIKTVICG